MLEQDAVVEAVWKERIPLGATRSNARAGQPVVTAIEKSGSLLSYARAGSQSVRKEWIPLGLTRSNARAGRPVVTAIEKSGSHWGHRGLHTEGFVVYILRALWCTY